MNFEVLKQKAVPILKRHGVVSAAVFGSYARNEQNDHSDVDIIIRYSSKNDKTLLDLVRLRDELKEVLQVEVDLLTEKSIPQSLRDDILRDKQVLI